SCDKKWTFLEALTTFAPVLGTVWKDSIKDLSTPEDRLWEKALKSLSTRKSDESNIVVLLKLAKLEGINELKVVMPYSLEDEQIEYIESRSHLVITGSSAEEFTIKL
ncbi:transporter, partial [Vibrio fortis]